MKNLTVHLSDELHSGFKKYCVEKGISMKDRIISHILDDIAKEENKKVKKRSEGI